MIMLGREQKIRNLIIQRNFILDQLKGKMEPSYRFIGQVFKENIEFFENEGYNVTCITKACDIPISIEIIGKPIYLFTIKEDVPLTDEELALSEVAAQEVGDMQANIQESIFEGIQSFLENLSKREERKESIESNSMESLLKKMFGDEGEDES